ncbi:MAG TPA: RidA family protein [Thermoclostridium sp.]|nr:RidA family protein [Thermoclostridium sp.]
MKKQLTTTNAPVAIGPYSQGVEVNGLVFVSGQLPIDPKTGETAEGGIKGQTLQIFKNIEAILKEANMTLDNVVKTTVFLTDMADFAAMNEVYAAQFSGIFPARSAFAVKTLPKNAEIEIEVIAMRDN